MDVGINFHIGRNEETLENDAKRFFYNFGPNRLQELLQEETEEQVRNFVKSIKVMRIQDVKSEITVSILKNLHEKFLKYGVVIEQINIMSVFIPRDLREFLNNATNYDVYLQKQTKQHIYMMKKLDQDENKAILELQRDNMKKLQGLVHDIDVAKIE